MPGIVVLNANFVPYSLTGPFRYGATYYAFEVAKHLSQSHSFLGFILYKRDESLNKPYVKLRDILGFNAIEMGFHYGFDPARMKVILSQAAETLKEAALWRSCNGDSKTKPIFYYQTNALLVFHPEAYPYVVTHHAPFTDQVVRAMGMAHAVEGFGGGEAKLVHLKKMQQAGLAMMRYHRIGVAVELSKIQTRYLLDRRIPNARIFRVSPPVKDHSTFCQTGNGVFQQIREFTDRHARSLPLITAMARLDRFKNVALLVDASVDLMKMGFPLATIIVGGISWEDPDRQRILEGIPSRFRPEFLFLPRLARDVMIKVFRDLVGKALFVCTSRYETCGFTPLEAACAGLAAIVPNDCNHVEAASFFPESYRFEPNLEGLKRSIETFYSNRDWLDIGQDFLNGGGSDGFNGFASDFLKVWSHLSSLFRAVSAAAMPCRAPSERISR